MPRAGEGGSDLTYAQVGATRPGGSLPAGYRHVRRLVEVGRGEAAFTAGRAGLAEWRMFHRAGLVTRTPAPTAGLGVEFANGLGVGPLRLWVPCRIVWLVDEPGRYGYGFGTLPGHPEVGEEAFELTMDAEGRVRFAVRAFSRPGAWYARLGGPVARAVQDWMTDRYVAALRDLVVAP